MIENSLEAIFHQKLIDSAHWDDLMQVIVQYPSTIMAAASVCLFIRNPNEPGFSYAAQWFKEGASTNDEIPEQLSSSCNRCLAAKSFQEMVVASCSTSSESQKNSSTVQYCVPLVFSNKLVAILQIYLPADRELSNQQIESLSRVLPEMSLAIENFQLQRSVRILADEADSSRRHFAQDLHDSLAQDIGYLRLKLDQFSDDGTPYESPEIQQDIKHMRDVATKAYEKIRGTLTILDPTCKSDLTETLRESAICIGERAGFAVMLESQPDRFPLAPEVCRQIAFISQEALNNVEKHANAQLVTLQIDWGEKDLTLSIADDGRGFDLDEVPTNDHLGLAIMKQRAQSIGGELTIDSRIDSGTQVTLRVPATEPKNEQVSDCQVNEGQILTE